MSDVAEKETLGFQTEVQQLLKLMIHSLYSNKEIFLRELVSNASDALDKLRHLAITDKALLKDEPELKIQVDVDSEAKTITITDTGIGMSRQEMMEHLGTIAKSGTQEFLSQLTGEDSKDSALIGQFGVGFYSAFIVAAKVVVSSRKAGLDASEGACWSSEGDGEYTIENIDRAERGTSITLHLKADEGDFLDAFRLKNTINKYSEHISFPVYMLKNEIPGEQEEGKEDEKAQAKAPEYEAINSAKALWKKSKKEINDEEYKEFYKHIAHDFQDPLVWSHQKVEGKMDYTSLLYIPSKAPFDLWNRERPRGLKLYVQRVFIMDEAEQFLPLYLRFVKGIVDSNDLSLNVSRELLQTDKQVDTMRAALVKRVLKLLEGVAKDDAEKYQAFWDEFGSVLKEGIGEDFNNREQLTRLYRFSSTHTDSEVQNVSLADYISRMQEGQDKIFYTVAETFASAKNSPHLEIFRKKGIEVLLLSDRVDEWVMSHLTEFEGKSFQPINKGEIDLGGMDSEEEKAEQEEISAEFDSVLKQVKTVLGESIADARLTYRLTGSPACVVVGEQDMGAHMQRLLKAAGQHLPESKPILELNPEHLLVKRLQDEQDDEKFAELTWVLFEQSILAEGGHLEDPATFVKRLNALMLTTG